ncbi:MAG: maleylpyruvate isomerase N-terminal domain-containing protein [Candidatus Limnocylindrales bacterium]
MTDRSFVRANDESRERLARLVETLTPSQLAIDLGEGWTVVSALGHMGFWDRWQAGRWTEMLAGRWSAQDDSVVAAEHLANEALHPYWAGIDAEDIPALALEAAAKLDALVASAPDALVDAVEGTPSAYLLHRHRHRGEHLDHIERAMAAAAQPLDRSFEDRNAASRRRLASLVERLREADMTLPTEDGGWTVAQVLGHLAFWDRSMETRWRLAAAGVGDGREFEPASIPNDLTDAINLPLADLLRTWTERLGTDLGAQALAAAESLDALLVELAGRLPDGLAARRPHLVNRWSHREPHLEQLERALAAGRPAAAPVDRSYVARNAASQARLREFLGGLSAADLARSARDGEWTVGQILGHLTFWDRFLAARWRAAQAGGPGGQPTFLPHELADLLNDGLPPTWGAFASGAADAVIAETLAAAEEVDRIIAGLPDPTPIEAILAERPALLDRSIHRREHLAALERATS